MNIPMIVWHQQWRKTVWRALIAVMCDGKIDKRRVQVGLSDLRQSVHVPCLPLFFCFSLSPTCMRWILQWIPSKTTSSFRFCLYSLHPWHSLDICQKIYTTRFLCKKFYTLKVRKIWLFLLKKKQRKCINISYFSSFFVRI